MNHNQETNKTIITIINKERNNNDECQKARLKDQQGDHDQNKQRRSRDEDECQEPHHENIKMIMIKRSKQEGNGDEH